MHVLYFVKIFVNIRRIEYIYKKNIQRIPADPMS